MGGEGLAAHHVLGNRHCGAARLHHHHDLLRLGARSGSQSDCPMGRPAASMNVLAMPPPTMSWSTFSESDFRIVILVETLAPATIATTARFALASPPPSASTPPHSTRPPPATFSYFSI